jgi:aspartokinase
MDKFLMEGCKVAGGLFQAELLYSSPEKGVLTDLLGRFVEHRINLDLLTGRQTDDRLELDFLVSSEDAKLVRGLIQSDPEPGRRTSFRSAVDVLNIFPHKADLRAVGLGLLAFAREGIPLYGFCSSLSTLTFVTDPGQTEKALSALGACFDLPQAASTASEG